MEWQHGEKYIIGHKTHHTAYVKIDEGERASLVGGETLAQNNGGRREKKRNIVVSFTLFIF